MERFKNQVAVISGGAEGLGKGIADRLASEGATVALFDINQQLLNKTATEFKAKGHNVSSHLVDVASEDSVRKAMEEVEATYGQIDIMINCAGIVGPTSTNITDYPTEAFDKIYNINLRGSFLMTKYALMAMKKKNY